MNRPRRWEWAVLALILLVGAFLRLYRLDAVPPGLTHDEADTGYFVAAVYRGAPSQVETPYGYAYKPLTQYSAAPFMAFFGPNDLALRLHSAFFSMVLLIFTYLWVRRAFGVAAGLGSAGLMAVSFWTVCDGRFALNSGPAPALFTGAVYFLWLAIGGAGEKSRWWAWATFALLLAGSVYAYEAAGAAAMAFGPLFVYLTCVDRPRFRRYGAWLFGSLVIAALLVAPHLFDPASWGRTSTLSVPIQAAAQGDFKPLLVNVVSTLGTFTFSGDSFVTYNLPGRPIFDSLVGMFLYGGVVLCVWRWRKPAYAFLLMWVAMGIVPSLLLGEWTSTLHSKAAETPILALPALCAVEIGRLVGARFGRWWTRVFAVLCAVWLVVVAVSTGYDYFVRWGKSPDTRAAYFHNLVAITDYLDETEYSGAVALSSPFPDQPLDPFIADMRVHRSDLALRWFDARRAVVFPDTGRSLFTLPPNTPLAPEFAERLDLQLVQRVPLRPDDVDPYFDVFEWNPSAVLSRFVVSPAGEVIVGTEPTPLPVNFGGTLELLSYELPAPEIAPGGEVTLITCWHVRDPSAMGPVPAEHYGRGAVIFVHLLDASGTIIGQEDRLDAPAWSWRSGDAFVQLHRFRVDAPFGVYRPSVGLYDRHSTNRLPIVVDGVELADHVLLEPLKVTGE